MIIYISLVSFIDRVLSAYMKHLSDTDDVAMLNTISFYRDIEACLKLVRGPESKQKKDALTSQIMRHV